MKRFLIVGDTEDLTMAWTARVAGDLGCEVVRLDEAGFGEDWTVSGPADRAILKRQGENPLRLNQCGPAMVGFQPEPDISVKAAQDGFDRYLFARERRSGIHRFLAALPHPVCNPPFSGLPNNSKPLQMRLLQRAGFRVPEWLVTNDAAQAEEFAAAHGDVIVKALSGMRSQVRAYGDTHRSALAEGTAPFVMQRRIKGPNVRVHTFGAHCFATRIESPDMIDYRFETGEQKWSACDAPPGIAQLCRDYVESEGLIIGGLDFLVDEDGWWCLECNPAPTFITYEFSAKQPIADALVRHLLDIPSGTRAERVA